MNKFEKEVDYAWYEVKRAAIPASGSVWYSVYSAIRSISIGKASNSAATSATASLRSHTTDVKVSRSAANDSAAVELEYQIDLVKGLL